MFCLITLPKFTFACLTSSGVLLVQEHHILRSPAVLNLFGRDPGHWFGTQPLRNLNQDIPLVFLLRLSPSLGTLTNPLMKSIRIHPTPPYHWIIASPLKRLHVFPSFLGARAAKQRQNHPIFHSHVFTALEYFSTNPIPTTHVPLHILYS